MRAVLEVLFDLPLIAFRSIILDTTVGVLVSSRLFARKSTRWFLLSPLFK